MAARVRSVDWAASALTALDEALAYISQDSPQAAADLLARLVDAGASLATLSDRGRVVPETDDRTIREVFVYRYRLMYHVQDERVLVVAFVHGAMDFAELQRIKPTE